VKYIKGVFKLYPNNYYPLIKKYGKYIAEPEWAIDARHVMILYNLLLVYPYKRVLEIGSHYGVSTTAFVEALNQGASFKTFICDICFLDSVKELCQSLISSGQVQLNERKSSEYLLNAQKFDLALLDGSHIAEHVQDEFELLSLNSTQTYILHDTRTQLLPESKETPWYDGPLRIAEKLAASPDWLCIEDSIDRKGELTKRGFFFATRDIGLYRKATEIFNYWTNISTKDLLVLMSQ
jgi:cephalosporin hydroxylase